MKKFSDMALPIYYRLLADLIFVFHFIVVMIIVFGWLFPSIWPLYMFTLIMSLAFDIILGYCLVSKWEFELRKKANPDLVYEYNFTSYYTHRITNKMLSEKFLKFAIITFLSFSIIINIVFYFLV